MWEQDPDTYFQTEEEKKEWEARQAKKKEEEEEKEKAPKRPRVIETSLNNENWSSFCMQMALYLFVCKPGLPHLSLPFCVWDSSRQA